jgi:replicative superfamily II helicase
MHVIGDASRGYNLEILVSKLKYLQLKADAHSKRLHIQIVALSATISNLPSIADWFNATLYQTSFRPVPLQEMIVSGRSVYDTTSLKEIRPMLSLSTIREAMSNRERVQKQLSTLSEEMQQILSLCLEGLRNKQQIIVFCTSRNQCQITAKLLSDILCNIDTRSPLDINDNHNHTAEVLLEQRMTAVEKMRSGTSEFKSSLASSAVPGAAESPQSILKKCILNGVAFHHAGELNGIRLDALVQRASMILLLTFFMHDNNLRNHVNITHILH